MDSPGEQETRLIAHRLRHEPLDDDAGIDGHPHRSRSSRSRSALSLRLVPVLEVAQAVAKLVDECAAEGSFLLHVAGSICGKPGDLDPRPPETG